MMNQPPASTGSLRSSLSRVTLLLMEYTDQELLDLYQAHAPVCQCLQLCATEWQTWQGVNRIAEMITVHCQPQQRALLARRELEARGYHFSSELLIAAWYVRVGLSTQRTFEQLWEHGLQPQPPQGEG